MGLRKLKNLPDDGGLTFVGEYTDPVSNPINTDVIPEKKNDYGVSTEYFISDKSINTIVSPKDFVSGKNIDEFTYWFYNKYDEKIEEAIDFDKEYLEENEISLPSNQVKIFAKEILAELNLENLFPYKITTTVEEGLCLIFENKKEELYLELYNDGDIGYIIIDKNTQEIIVNKDLNSSDSIKEVVKSFL